MAPAAHRVGEGGGTRDLLELVGLLTHRGGDVGEDAPLGIDLARCARVRGHALGGGGHLCDGAPRGLGSRALG